MKTSGYNTNLASEYFVLSMLYRFGAEASLTLGNKKSVDIIVLRGRDLLSIDVKGIAGKTLWPLDNFSKPTKNHYIAFVSFLGHIGDSSVVPEVYILPSDKIETFMYRNPKGNRKGITLSRMRHGGQKYKDAWEQFVT
ncbi:MAG TPA: hypothetical protein VGB26_14255 [Nitrospiria bacterium]|jgi:hypothetical protein